MATSEYLKDTEKRSGPRMLAEAQLRGKSIAGVSQTAPALRMLKDGILIAISVGAAIVIRYILLEYFSSYWEKSLGLSLHVTDILYFGWFTFCYILVARRYGLYAPAPLRNGAHETRLIAQAVFTAMLYLCGALYMMHNISLSRLLILIFVVVAAFGLSMQRAAWRRARYRDYEQGIELRNVLVLGTNRLSAALGEQMAERTHLGRHLSGYITIPGNQEEPEVPSKLILGGLEDLRQIVRGRFVDELVIAQPCATETAIRLVEEARALDIDLSSITGYFSDLSANAPHERIGYYPIVLLHRRERRVLSLVLKRIADIALSFLAILLVLPAMAVISLAILAEGTGPIFYISERIGKRGRYFKCLKFRTMVADAEKRLQEIAKMNERDGILFKMSNDPRITPLGKFLRKYSLDELPQFFNVLRGEMSLVGPRPPLESEVERYELDHLRRLDVLPGLTGLWQIQARQNSSFDRYIALDTAYIENWSFWLDLTILIRTVGVVMRGTGT